MLLLSQAPNGALSARRCPSSSSSSSYSSKPSHPLFSKSRPRFLSRNSRRRTLHLAVSNADSAGEAGPSTRPIATPFFSGEKDDTVFVGDDGVPLEGVIQFEKSGFSSKLVSWGTVGLLAGGDVLCLLVFSAIGRFSHGMPVVDLETLKTADPFVAGWIFSAYFFGAYGDDGKGLNGSGKAIASAAKSWALGIPLGIGIRALASGHIPQASFILVAMGSTGILLIAWRALVSNLLSSGRSKQNDVYRRGSPFELFELLTSLVRRW